MRLFIGLPLPESYQDRLQGVIDAWRPKLKSRISWTRPGNWHLTLKFIGEVSHEASLAIIQSLQQPLGESFVFQAGNGGFFPDQKRPRVMWVGVARGGARCRAMASVLEQRLALLGFPLERRVFSPHLTVGRVREVRNDPWPDVVRSLCDTVWPDVVMERVVLWESRLSETGPNYQLMAEFGLV